MSQSVAAPKKLYCYAPKSQAERVSQNVEEFTPLLKNIWRGAFWVCARGSNFAFYFLQKQANILYLNIAYVLRRILMWSI